MTWRSGHFDHQSFPNFREGSYGFLGIYRFAIGCWTKNREILPPKWMMKIMENPILLWMIWGAHPYFWKDAPLPREAAAVARQPESSAECVTARHLRSGISVERGYRWIQLGWSETRRNRKYQPKPYFSGQITIDDHPFALFHPPNMGNLMTPVEKNKKTLRFFTSQPSQPSL